MDEINYLDKTGLEHLVGKVKTADDELKKQADANVTSIELNAQAIKQEALDRVAGDNQLDTAIKANAKSISDEATRATNAEGKISDALNEETKARKLEDGRLGGEIQANAEAITKNSQAITTNAETITAETERATKAEGDISGALQTETEQRTAEDKKLADEIAKKQDKLTIDAEMSAVSKNPVENQAITNYVDAAATIEKSAEGETITLDDSGDYPLAHYEIEGAKSTQAGVPTPDAPQEIQHTTISDTRNTKGNLAPFYTGFDASINGVRFYEKDGKFYCSGKVKDEISIRNKFWFENGFVQTFGAGTYTFEHKRIDIATTDTYFTFRKLTDGVEVEIISAAPWRDKKVTVTFDKPTEVRFCCYMRGDTYPIDTPIQYSITKDGSFNDSAIGTRYVLSRPVDLYGLGDVRDSIEKRDGVWGVMRRVRAANLTPANTWTANGASFATNRGDAVEASAGEAVCLCNYFNSVTSRPPQDLPNFGVTQMPDRTQFIFRYDGKTLDQFKAWLDKVNGTGNKFTLIYKLASPTFEPLPQTDQVKLNGLKTFFPTTTLSTQGKQRIKYLSPASLAIEKKQNKLIAGAGIKLEDKGEQTEISVVPTNVASVYKGVTPNITAPSTIQPLNTSPVFLENISGLEKNSQYLAVVSFGQFDMNDTLAQLSLNSSGVSRNFYITGNAPGSYAIPVKTNGNGIVNIDAYLRPQGDQPITGLTIAHAYIDLNYVGKVDVLRPQMKPSEMLRPATKPDAPQVIDPGMEVDPDATLEIEQPVDPEMQVTPNEDEAVETPAEPTPDTPKEPIEVKPLKPSIGGDLQLDKPVKEL